MILDQETENSFETDKNAIATLPKAETAEKQTSEEVHESEERPESIGTIYGDVGTNEFKFSVLTKAERSDYISVDHPDCGPVLCQVSSIIRKTNYTLDKSLKADSDDEIEEKLSAQADVIGYRDDKGLLQIPRTTFKAGSEVYTADPQFIKKVLGLKTNPKKCAYIGLLRGYDMPLMLDINELVQRHVCILAKTGGGKSYISGDIIEELMKHDVTCVIIDPHGEYGAMRNPGTSEDPKFNVSPHGYDDKIIEFGMTDGPNIKPLRFTFKSLDARDILDLFQTGDVRNQLPVLKKALDSLREKKDLYSIKDLIEEITSEGRGHPLLVSELEYLDEIGLFAERGNHITELIQKGKTTIINLKGVAPDVQQLIVRRWGILLFELRKMDRIPPLMMVIEEAHNYCPQNENTLCKKSLSTIASEGRKFGLGLMVISQRPAKIDKNVLSQCGTQIVLKVTNPNDLKAIAASMEGLTAGMEQDIQGLPIGTALVVGSGIQTPMLVEVRPRESKHGGASVQIIGDDNDE